MSPSRPTAEATQRRAIRRPAQAGPCPRAPPRPSQGSRSRTAAARRPPDRARPRRLRRLGGVQEQLLAVVAPAGVDRGELVRLRGGRDAARVDPGRAQPPTGLPVTDQPVDGEGGDLDRGPPLLPARRRGLVGHLQGGLARRDQGQGGRGRLDHPAAGRPQPLPDLARADAAAQGQGGLPGGQAQQPMVEGPDPGDLDEPGLLRQPRLRRRGCVADVLLEARRGTCRSSRLHCSRACRRRRLCTTRSSSPRRRSSAGRTC